MDYHTMSDKELCRLLRQRLPELTINEVNDYNRETVIACLKLYETFGVAHGQDIRWNRIAES
jgi:hypothetical protein